MGKFLKVVGAIILTIAVLVVSLMYWASTETQEVTDAATPFIEESLPLFTTWDATQFEHLFTPDGLAAVQSDKGKKIINYISKVGKLNTFEPPVFVKSTSSISTTSGSREIAIFTVHAQFENGAGDLTLKLVRSESGYLFETVNVNSDVFLEQ
ncbi:hypothetical protein C9J12_05600 [Photobacterium frigidiphilum]|uniref:DUF4019 domain-containing protein n=1 Tax=Photobacterium frigidiphilum TaxID=264736 RepID=A0A2T3JMG2_9GAMM|nr:hypothetical protein [Photobacterium frigidiphilum]PSU50207.1 hypothetical protein C9J12_05600 [Photobacterium frigidiphilum]